MFEQSIAIASLSDAREPQACRTVDCRGKEDMLAADGRQKEVKSTVCLKPRFQRTFTSGLKSLHALTCLKYSSMPSNRLYKQRSRKGKACAF
jgi:hypothetical protein